MTSSNLTTALYLKTTYSAFSCYLRAFFLVFLMLKHALHCIWIFVFCNHQCLIILAKQILFLSLSFDHSDSLSLNLEIKQTLRSQTTASFCCCHQGIFNTTSLAHTQKKHISFLVLRCSTTTAIFHSNKTTRAAEENQVQGTNQAGRTAFFYQ